MSQLFAKQIDGLFFVEMEGEVTLEVVDSQKEEIFNVLNDNKNPILIDMSGVSFMDSGAIGFIVSILKKAQQEKWGIALAGAEGQPRIVLGMVGIDEHVRIFDTVDRARAFLKKDESAS